MTRQFVIATVRSFPHNGDSAICMEIMPFLHMPALIAVAVVSSASSVSAKEGSDVIRPFKGALDFSVNSSRVSYNLAVRDAPVSTLMTRLSDFRVADTVLPVVLGGTCKCALSNPSRYPEERLGDIVELNTTCGVEWSRYVRLDDYVRMNLQWHRWTYPSTHKPPLDAVVVDSRLKTYFNPGVLLRYRYHGLSEGRMEGRISVLDEWNVYDEVKAFGYLNAWIIDYRHERRKNASGASAGELALGLAWRMLYFRTSYWFPLDRRVLDDGAPNYNHIRNVIVSFGMRITF